MQKGMMKQGGMLGVAGLVPTRIGGEKSCPCATHWQMMMFTSPIDDDKKKEEVEDDGARH